MKYFILILSLLCASVVHAQGTCPTLTPNAGSAKCYFIAASGSDTNSGTTEAAPFAHSPGMFNCTSNCASASTAAGIGYIFKGGDTWHGGNSSLTPYIGASHFNWSHSGTAATCQLDITAGAISKTGCIYFGVDLSWFTGGSWARPQLNFDNPISTTPPGSCTFDQDSANLFQFNGSNYIILDNLELFGWCSQNANNNSAVTSFGGAGIEVTNCYFHGAILASTSTGDSDEFVQIAFTSGFTLGFIEVDHNVFDNSDGTCGNFACSYTNTGVGDFYATGKILGVGTEIGYNVFQWIQSAYIGGSAPSFHDNLMPHINESFSSTHGNIYEQQGGGNHTNYTYNNLSYEDPIGQGWDMNCSVSQTCYYFNQVQYYYRPAYTGTTPSDNSNGSSCYLLEDAANPGSTSTYYFINNTTVASCNMSQKSITTTVHFASNHFVAYTNLSSFESVATPVDAGGEIFQTLSVANGQGYLPADFYAPASSGGSTIHAGIDNTTLCGTLANSIAAAACLRSIGTFNYNQTNHTITVTPGTLRPSGNWDSGAYQFGGTSTAGTPTASPVAGTYSGTQNVTFSVTGGAPVICVAVSPTVPATNGTSGCTSGTLYTSPVSVSTSQTLKAIAGGTGFLDGAVGTFAYTITVPAGGVRAPGNLQATANVQIQ